MASSSRGVQQDSFIDEDEDTCPLCIEEMDLSDKNFRPCPCGYQVCQFCFNNIKNNMNGLCPACRRPYDEKTMEFKIVSPEEIAQFKANAQKNAKRKAAERQKEAQKREVESLNRKHLAGLRVVQKNLVYVVGLSPGIPEQDLLKTLRGDKYFGQYGNIVKIVVSKAKAGDPSMNGSSLGVYVTFSKKEDAARCIAAVNGSQNGDRVLRAQLGTTKYCSAYLRGESCTNKQCMFLHEPGDNDDSYSRQDLSSINSVGTQRPLPVTTPSTTIIARQAAQAQAPIQQSQPVAAAAPPMAREVSNQGSDGGDGSALPSSASWANRGLQNISRRGSLATSGAASSPAISHAIPAPTEAADEETQSSQGDQRPETSHSSAATPASPVQPRMDPLLMSLIRSINAMQISRPSEDSDSEISQFPPLFDEFGGARRRIAREQDEAARIIEEEARRAELETQSEVQTLPEIHDEEAPESGSLQLGGEPEDQGSGRNSVHPPGFPDQHRSGSQMPISRAGNESASFGGLGQGFPATVNARSLTPQQQQQHMLGLFKSAQPQTSFMDQFPPGIAAASQSSLFQQQGHSRQSSRFAFTSDNASVKSATSSKAGSQQQSMMGPQGGQFYGSSIQGPPPGLKSTGTPPTNGGGMFGQSGFSGALGGSYGGTRESELYRDMVQQRGRSGLGGEAGKRELMFPSFLNQYPSASSTPAPASGFMTSLYGSQAGAFNDMNFKQKKKGKKHRHANTSSSGGGGLVDLADPNLLGRMPLQQQQSNAGSGQGLFGGQAPGGYNQNMFGAGGAGYSRW